MFLQFVGFHPLLSPVYKFTNPKPRPLQHCIIVAFVAASSCIVPTSLLSQACPAPE